MTSSPLPVKRRINWRLIFWPAVGVVCVLVLLLRAMGPRVVWWQGQAQWREAAPGIETCRVSGWMVHGRMDVLAVRADPARCTVRVVDRHQGVKDVGAIARDVCPPVGAAMNANFFDVATLTPTGLVIADGKQHSPVFYEKRDTANWGIFLLHGGKPAIISSTAPLPRGATQAVQGASPLVVGGRIPRFVSITAAPRSGIGIDARGRIVLAVTESYVTYAQWAACLRDRLGCADALNLDGGPSAQLLVRGKVTDSTGIGDTVPVFITVEPACRATAPGSFIVSNGQSLIWVRMHHVWTWEPLFRQSPSLFGLSLVSWW